MGMERLVFVDTDRYGRVVALYGDRVPKLTRRQFMVFLRKPGLQR